MFAIPLGMNSNLYTNGSVYLFEVEDDRKSWSSPDEFVNRVSWHMEVPQMTKWDPQEIDDLLNAKFTPLR